MSMLVAENAVATVPARHSLVETFQYDNAMVRNFIVATAVWGLVAFLVGPDRGTEAGLSRPPAGSFPYLSVLDGFGRCTPTRRSSPLPATRIFAGVYYSLQRLCKARMFSDALSAFHFWGWQCDHRRGGPDAAARHHHQQGIRGTGMADRYRHHGGVGGVRRNMIGTIVTAPRAAHVRGDLVLHRHVHHGRPAAHRQLARSCRSSLLKSYSIYAGVQDALVQWWYGHNAVAFFLTTPFLGLMYYFLPEGGQPAGVFATGCRSCTSGR